MYNGIKGKFMDRSKCMMTYCRDSLERERERRQEMEMILYYEKTRLQRVGLRAKEWCEPNKL